MEPKMQNIHGGYDAYQKRVYAWLMVAKRIGFSKDIARFIASFIQVDLSGWIAWPRHKRVGKLAVWYNPPYEWAWFFKGQQYLTPPCPKCLRPCFKTQEKTSGSLAQERSGIKINKVFCDVHGERDFKREICMICSNPQNNANAGICLACVKQLVSNQNIILHNYITIANKKFIKELNSK